VRESARERERESAREREREREEKREKRESARERLKEDKERASDQKISSSPDCDLQSTKSLRLFESHPALTIELANNLQRSII
jgi:hypothetical protein